MVSPLKRTLKLVIVLLIIPITLNISPITCFSQSPRYIRVAIIQDSGPLRLGLSGPYEITDSGGKKVLSSGKNLKTTVTAYKGGILIGGNNFDNYAVFVSMSAQEAITIDDRKFRGAIKFIKTSYSRLAVINYIELEDYIKGILYHEASHYWPMEVLRAQAIACRTYAVYQAGENKLKDFDVTSDIYSQVYGGRISERYRTNKAVDETKGIIMNYHGAAFPAYFHATCGGHTEDASLLWKTDIAPLKGVSCAFCKDSPHFNWHYVLSLKEVKDMLIKSGLKVGNIKAITILGLDSSGRITDLQVVSDKGDVKISAKDFRNIIGPNIIRSTNFNISVIDKDIVFEGLGWGHGVGLCQWGAYFMAKQGYSAEQILKYYYPGSELTGE